MALTELLKTNITAPGRNEFIWGILNPEKKVEMCMNLLNVTVMTLWEAKRNIAQQFAYICVMLTDAQ